MTGSEVYKYVPSTYRSSSLLVPPNRDYEKKMSAAVWRSMYIPTIKTLVLVGASLRIALLVRNFI